MAASWRADDEGRHDRVIERPTDDLAWNETWYLDFGDPVAEAGGYVQLTVWPASGRSWFWASVAGADRPLVTVIDNEAPIPRPPSLELRASGLWVDLICETPFEHFTVGLEAFGVALDDPGEVFRGCRGDRTPLGFDLEWETPAAPRTVPGGYALDGVVHGEVLVGDERIDLDGTGRREHRWGPHRWWAETSGGETEVVAEAPVILERDGDTPTGLRRSLVRATSGELGWADGLS